MKHLIAPSILAADFANIQRDIEMINRSEADWIHVDIMDGVFVPNISFGFPVLAAVNKLTNKPLDVHLMIVDPDRYLTAFKDYGAANITVHYEACTHLHRTIQKIKELGCTAGVAVNPHTPIAHLHDIIEEIDLVCVMSVNPGFGGQKFIESTYRRIQELKLLAQGRKDALWIEIDGGVNQLNALPLLKAGANVLVTGNTVFSAENQEKTIFDLKNISTSTMTI
ncbi:ribulose-phosphate 3-epimerase [Olivibacter sp. SDN3]|uniref:ribulose-phosphate 3-epimerase n=1 Tax=Olivibacter sp. SDN3 TaxID=2764720 RepID=UPI001651357D|nr:ribulose-phosphate 3-epimerase [Olivibacter sp. SDN3]QNL48969.1 ribulose-phosphate 3-epimerase [Olivibacter sp. SDN3]